jgi:dihydrofolate synthase/folylpolyglutamate synthase
MNFSEATQYLFSLGYETLTIKLGLRNIELLLRSLGNPHRYFDAVQIAGTNGKGSTAVMLDSICRAAGISTGLYTSPHLQSVTERIKINGHDISEARFAELTTTVKAAADRLVADGELEALPTFFEHVTAIALLAFKEAGVALAILETGLGGRLDATTAAGARVVGITPISLDHQEYLGQALAEIAAEKAAVIRPQTTVVISPQRDEARRVIVSRCQETGVAPVWASEKDICDRVRLGLRGRHQLTNAAVAVGLAEALAISREAIVKGLNTARHPGRLELFESLDADRKVRVLLDGAHNPAGAEASRAYLEDAFRDTPITLVFGAMADKQVDEMAAILFPAAKRIVLTEPASPRSLKVQLLEYLAQQHAPGVYLQLTTDSASAMEAAIAITDGAEEIIYVSGSLYLVGEVRQWLQIGSGIAGRFS